MPYLYAAPVSTNDRLSDVSRVDALLSQFVGKENLLDAEQSTCGMVVTIAVQQAPVPKAPVAAAVAGLLCQHTRDVLRDSICFKTECVSEKFRAKRHWQRPSRFLTGEERRHAALGKRLLVRTPAAEC